MRSRASQQTLKLAQLRIIGAPAGWLRAAENNDGGFDALVVSIRRTFR
jgi:hypothetical protein